MSLAGFSSKSASGQFTLFAAGHSFLIGMLPFYLPVLIWEQTQSLAHLCLFIALTGLGFVLSLKLWTEMQKRGLWQKIILVSFILELLIVLAMQTKPEIFNVFWLFALGLINGAYACFYWTTQRFMFNAFTGSDNSGKHFGNFQIIVAVMLKVGIFSGGLLLENDQVFWLLSASILSSILFYLWIGKPCAELSGRTQGLNSKIDLCSRTKSVFYIDGVFLYLESYFWILTLYLVLKESFSTLGFVVVFLTIALSALFWILKMYIDQYNLPSIFHMAVILYCASWLLRSMIDADQSTLLLFVLVSLIAFFTAYFRLVFNKRFFDVAKQEKPELYIVLKSYMSQWGLVVFFSLSAMLSLFVFDSETALLEQISGFYLWLAPVSLTYLLYERVSGASVHSDMDVGKVQV